MKSSLIILFFALLTLGSCQQKKGFESVSNSQLESVVWQLTNILIDPYPLTVPDSLSTVLCVKFSEGIIEGFGGCNGFGGAYRIQGNRLTIEGLVHTEMYCESRSEWERMFLERLETSRTFHIQDQRLEINSGDMGGLVFHLQPKK